MNTKKAQVTETCSRCAEPMSRHDTGPRCPYNGWKNYETWNVALWIGNEPAWENDAADMAQAAWDEAGEGVSAYARMTGTEIFTREQRAAYKLADQLKAWVNEDLVPDLGASMASDLLSAALSEVDWQEIAEHYLDNVDKAEDDETEDEA